MAQVMLFRETEAALDRALGERTPKGRAITINRILRWAAAQDRYMVGRMIERPEPDYGPPPAKASAPDAEYLRFGNTLYKLAAVATARDESAPQKRRR